MATLTQTQIAAALAESVYRRSPDDQAIDPVQNLGGTVVSLGTIALQGLAPDASGYYYDNTTGFVGRVIDVGGTIYVVFRGTDIGTDTSRVAGLFEFVASGGTAGQAGGYDVLDWTRANLPLGLGIVGRTMLDGGTREPQLQSGAAITQLDDAVALMKAAEAAAGERPVVVVGQSLGGGLAGLVSALFGRPAYLFDPAPFANQLEVLAGQYAFSKNGLQPLLGLMQGGSDAAQEALLTVLGPLLSGIVRPILEVINPGSAAVSTLLQLGDDTLRVVMRAVAARLPVYEQQILDTLEAIIADRTSARNDLLDNLFEGTQAGAVHRVNGEALTAGPYSGYLRSLNSTPFAVDVQGFDVGEPSDTSANRDRTLALHSPALINLLERTKGSTRDFATLLKQDAVLRSSLFAQPEISAPVGEGRADPDGSSKVPGGGPATAILYNALWKTVSDTGFDPTSFYTQFYTRFGDWLSFGAVAAGKSGALRAPDAQTNDPDPLSIHSGLVKLGLQVVRDAIVRTPVNVTDPPVATSGINVFGEGNEAGPANGYVQIELSDIEIPEGTPPDSKLRDRGGQAYGVRDINYTIAKAVFERFSGFGLRQEELANYVIGALPEPVRLGTTAFRQWKTLIVQADSGEQPDGSFTFDGSTATVKPGAVVIGGRGDANITGTNGDDILVGESSSTNPSTGAPGRNTFTAGIGHDIVVGGAGDNTYIAQAATSADDGTTFLGGLGDKNIAVYGNEFDNATLILRPDPFLQTPEARGIRLSAANVVIGARKDILLGVQELNLHGNGQTLAVVGAGSQSLFGGAELLVVDGASADPSKGNTLDLQGFGGDTSVTGGMSDLGAALEAFKDRKLGETTKLQFKGFSTLKLNDQSNKAILRPSTAFGLHNLFMGDGNDTVDSAVENLRIDLGDGDDVLLRAGAGSIVAAGGGRDIFQMSNQVLLTGLKHEDKILIGSHLLTGGIRHQGSESPWAIGADGTRYGFDDLGNLIIKDLFGNVMGIANPVTGPGTFNTDTAGLYVAEVSLSFVRLRDLGAPDPNWQTHQFEYVNALSKAYSQTAIYRGVDPIVLDLAGAGLRFSDVNMAAPRFDINGNGFAVRTGWVKTGTGILVLDKNGNGKIDNVGEMFGGPDLNGFTALAAYDTVPDGIIDALDEIFSQLRVWVDGDGDAITDSGELKSFGDLGIASIGLETLPMVGTFIAGNQVLETGHFTWSDGSLGTVADVAFHVDNYDTRFLGDTSVGAAAEGLPNQKGYGTLTDLSVAITHDPALTDPPSGTSLRDVLLQTLPTLDTIDLATLRERVTPILTAWAAASRVIDPDGTLSSVTPSGHADLPILVRTTESGESVDDFAYQVTDAEGSYYRLASGTAVRDAEGEVVARPTLEQVMTQPLPALPVAEREWTTLSGAEIDFMERYLGDKLPFDTVPDNPVQALAALRPIVTQMHRTLDELAVNIAMAGPLAPYFVGIGYDVATNTFEATTSYQLEPMFEAIFRDAPADAAGATQWLEQWKPILDVVLGDFARGEGQDVTYGYRLANVVAAYEAASLPLDLRSAAITLGIPGDLIIAGGTELTSGGSNDANLFYLSNGDQTVTGGGGPDNYIVGNHIGHVTIIDHQPALGGGLPNTLRLAAFRSTDVIASRDGLDLILRIAGTDDRITVKNQFIGIRPGISGGGNLNETWGVAQIAFADGVVWEAPDIAFAVAPNTDGVDGRLIGTAAIDVLDSARGNHFLSGGDGGDVYLYDRGNGATTIAVNKTNIFSTNANYVSFGPGLTLDDVVFTRVGASADLIIKVKDDPSDTLVVQGQFGAAFTGVFGTQYLNQVQNFRFADGTILTWEDVQAKIIREAEATPGSSIYGFVSGDTIDPGVGSDNFMSGGDGVHTYVFGLGYGNDTIEVNTTNILSGSSHTVLFNPDVDPSQVQVVRNGGSENISLVLADGSTLTIVNQFDRAVPLNIWFDRVGTFQFQDAAQTQWTYLDIETKAIQYQLEHGHEVFGTPGDNAIDTGPGAGGYTVHGGDGADTYVIGQGYGQNTISADAQVGDSRTLLFNAEVDPSTVRFSRGANYDELLVTLADGSSVDIRYQFGHPVEVWTHAIDRFQFQDASHTVLTYDEVALRALQDQIASGSPTIWGTQNSDTLDPGQGSGGRYLSGGRGGDVYVFGLGYGHNTIFTNHAFPFSADTLLFNAGVDLGAVHFARGANLDDLVITLADGSKLDIQSQFGSLARFYSVAAFQLQDANHTLLTAGDIENLVIATEEATPGATVRGFHGGTTFNGHGGNNTLIATGGGNTFVFDHGYGHEVAITEGGPDIVQLGAGITPDMVVVSRPARANSYSSDRDLVIRLADTGETLTVRREFRAGSPSPVTEVRFADGTVWDVDTLVAEASTPQISVDGDGTVTLTGDAVDDILTAQAPNTVARYDVDNVVVELYQDRAYIRGANLANLGDTITGIRTVLVTGANAEVRGSSEADTLTAAGVNDTLEGNEGADTLTASGISATLHGGWGDDTLIAAGNGDTLHGDQGADTLIGSGVSATLRGGLDGDTLVDAGGDHVVAYYAQGNVEIDLAAGQATRAGAAGDTLVGITAVTVEGSGNRVSGGAGADTLVSSDLGYGNTLIGGAGDTVISRGSGDILIGSGGTTLSSSGHANQLIAGSGADTVVDSGTDDVIVANGSGATLDGTDATRLTVRYVSDNIVVDLAAGTAHVEGSSTADTLIAIRTVEIAGTNSTLIGHADGDVLIASGTGNTVIAGSGAETLMSHGNNNTLVAGDGDTTFVYGPSDGNVEIQVHPLASWAPHTYTLRFTHHNQADVIFSRVGDSLVVGVNGFGGNRITIDDEYLDGQGVQRLQFADGTIMDRAAILDLIQGVGPGVTRSIAGDNLTITVQDQAHLSLTGSGNAVDMIGGDATVVATGDANSVGLRATGDSATLFGNGASATARADDVAATINGDNASIMSFANATRATINGSFGEVVSFGEGLIAAVNGDFGRISTFGAGGHLTLSGGFGNVSAFGDNQVIALQGDNGRIQANGANGRFVLHGDHGTLSAFGANAHFELYGDFGSIQVSSDDDSALLRGDFGSVMAFGNNATIELDGNGGTVTLFGDNQTVTLLGADGTVSFGGTNGHVTVDSARGHTISYYTGSGDLEIAARSGSGGASANTLSLGGYSAADVAIGRDTSDLTITVNENGARITIKGAFSGAALGQGAIQQVMFTDGSIVNAADIAGGLAAILSADGATITTALANDVVQLQGNNQIATLSGDGAEVSSTGSGNSIGLQGANEAATIDGSQAWIGNAGSGNTITVNGDQATVFDHGAGNTTILNGDNAYAFLGGTGGTIVNSGDGNTIHLDSAQTVTTTGDDTVIHNHGMGTTIDLVGANNRMDMTGSQHVITVSGDHGEVVDDGSDNTVILNGDRGKAFMRGTDGTVVSTGVGNYLELHGSQTVTVTGADSYVLNAGTGIEVTFDADDESTSMTGAGNITTVNGAHGTVYDHGIGNTTILNGDDAYAFLAGSGGTIVNTGEDNTIHLDTAQTVTTTGDGTIIHNHGSGTTIDLAGDNNRMDMTGSQHVITVSGNYGEVSDYGSDNTVILSGNQNKAFMLGPDGTVISTGVGNYLELHGSQTVTVTGADSYVLNAGTGIEVTFDADDESTSMTGSNNTTTVNGAHGTVYDSGSGNTTILNGDNAYALVSGTDGTVISTGDHNVIGLSGTQTVTVSGNDTRIANYGEGMTIDLAGDNNWMDMTGSQHVITASGDHTRINDYGADNVVMLSGDANSAYMRGTGGTVISTGVGNFLELHGSQTVTVTGADSYVLNAGTGIEVTFDADNESTSMTGSGNTTTVNGDYGTVYDSGTGNTTILNGDNAYTFQSGTGGTITSTGVGNLVHVTGVAYTLNLTGAALTLSSSASATLTGSGNSVLVEAAMLAATGDNNTVRAADGGVTLDVTGDGNTLRGGGGGDTLTASGGDNTLEGGGGADTLTAGNGNDTLVGGGGNDVLTGGAGNDTFAILRGDGNDVIHASASDGADTVAFGSSVTHEQLWFARTGDDLVMSVIGEGQAVTVAGWYAASANRANEVTAGDGYTIGDAAIEQLVEAMASFTPPASGQTTLPPELAANLAPALSANWQHQ